MEGLTRFVLRHRWGVLATWLVVFLVAGFASSKLADLLTNRFTLPGTDSQRVESILQDHFGQRSTGSFTVVVEGDGNAKELVPQVRAAAEKAAAALPTGRLVAVTPASADVVSAQIVSDLEPADSKGHTDDMRSAVGSIPGAQVYITGQTAIEHDLDPVFAEDLKKGELYIAIPIALLILVFTFGTLSFLLPFFFTIVTIPTTLGLIWIFANFMELTTYLTNLVALIGLALLLFMPLPFMRGFGVGGLLIPAVSVLAAVTLLPVILSFLGQRLDRVRLLPQRWLDRRADHERGFWAKLAWTIMRHPKLIAGVTAGLLILLTLPVLTLQLGPGSNEGIPRELEGMRGLDVLTEAVGAGATAPSNIVIDSR